jgi:hypothetical protein
MELRLRHGGLGGVQACDRWDKRLSAAKTVKDFVSWSTISKVVVTAEFLRESVHL